MCIIIFLVNNKLKISSFKLSEIIQLQLKQYHDFNQKYFQYILSCI